FSFVGVEKLCTESRRVFGDAIDLHAAFDCDADHISKIAFCVITERPRVPAVKRRAPRLIRHTKPPQFSSSLAAAASVLQYRCSARGRSERSKLGFSR